MVVHVQGGQAADIDLEHALPGQGIGELVVETVDALDDQHVVLPQGQLFTVILPLPLLEVIGGQVDGLPPQQAAHVRVELLHVHGLQTLKVILPVGVLGGQHPVFEIVVRGDGVGHQAAGHQLGGQPVREGGLARGGWSGDHHKAHIPAVRDLLGDVADLLFHQGLLAQDHLGGQSGGDHVVDLPHVVDVQGRRAPGHVVHGMKYFDGGLERPQVLRVTLAGQTEDKAVLKRLQGEALHIARVGGHVAVEIVSEVPHAVQIHPGAHAIAQQPGLVLHAHIPQPLYPVVGADRLLDDGRLLRRQGPHPGLHPLQQGFVQGKVPRRPQEQGVA